MINENSKTEDQKHIISAWVSDETKKALEEANDPETKERILYEKAQEQKKKMQTDLDMLSDDVMRYKGLLAGYRQEFKEVQKEHAKKMEDIWHDFEEIRTKHKKKADRLAEDLSPLKEELKNLGDMLRNLDTYNLQDLTKTIKEINSNFYGETKEILKFLFENYYDDSKEN